MIIKLLRIIYIVIAYFLLWVNPQSSFGFFTGILMFSFGFLIDYSSLYKDGHKFLGIFGSIISAIYLSISLLGLIQIFNLVKVDNVYILKTGSTFMGNISISMEIMLYGLLMFAILAGGEFISVCFSESKGN